MTLKMNDREFTSTLVVGSGQNGSLSGQWLSQWGENEVTDVVYERGSLSFKRKTKMQDREWESTFEGDRLTLELAPADIRAVLRSEARTSIVLDPRSPKGARTLYAGVFDAGVFKPVDDGRTWTSKRSGLGHPDNLRVYRVILHADGTVFASICAKRPSSGAPLMSDGVGLYRSRDVAETWEKIDASQPLRYVKDFSVHPGDSGRILLGACDSGRGDRSGGLYFTEDGGQSWRRIGRQGPQTFGGYFHPRREGWIYMTLTEGAPGAGLWLSRDHGQRWEPFDELPFSNIQRVEFDPCDEAHLRVTTFGGSVWHGPVVPHHP